MDLSPIMQDFVLHFGEMGSRWGISRTVGQIYALLFIANAPLNAEDICERLGFSRSNVSMGLKELQAWNLVRLRHLPGDRRDYFTTRTISGRSSGLSPRNARSARSTRPFRCFANWR